MRIEEREPVTKIHTELTTLRSRLSRVHQRLEFETAAVKKIEARLTEIEAEKAKLVKVVALIDKGIEIISANGVGRIETTVTNGMRLVFDDPSLALKIVKNSGARGSSYELVGQQGEVEGPFLDTFGGGIANVVSILLRIIMLKRFKMAKLLVCDESFNNVSEQYLPMVSQLLRSLAKDGGYTILAVTHQSVLAQAADTIYEVVPQEGDSPKLVLTTAGALAAQLTDARARQEDQEPTRRALLLQVQEAEGRGPHFGSATIALVAKPDAGVAA